MPEDEIKKLPTIKICQDDVDKNLQCTVCMDDYKLDEPVRMLPCNHVYHNDCIVPWLEMVSNFIFYLYNRKFMYLICNLTY